FVDMRFRYQVHEIRVPVTGEDRENIGEILTKRFIRLYEQAFGIGSARQEITTEIVTFHVVSAAPAAASALSRGPSAGRDRPQLPMGSRDVYFDNGFKRTPVYDVGSLSVGIGIEGPAVIEAPNTTIVVYPGQTANIDEHLNVFLDL